MPAADASPPVSGEPPVSSAVRSPGSDTCCGSGNGSPGICGRLSCACGSMLAGPVAGAAAAGAVDVRPGRPRLGAAAVAGAGVVSPGIPSPGVAVVAAGAGDAKPGSSDEPA